MSTATLNPADTRHQGPTAGERSMARGRQITIILLLGSLLLSALLRTGVHAFHNNLIYSDRPRPSNRLQGIDTFALGLILGGLRGPLVMFLWTSTENQKTARDLEDFDTKIDLIRMLQPEFDSVHIFQIWNKGYNVTVQVATMPNKYATILDAIRYARDINAQRPDNINILVSLADMYFNKLGNSAEKRYYQNRIREDSMFREQRTARLSGQRLMRHDPLLTPEGMIQEKFLTAQSRVTGKSDLPGREPYNGAELQFLRKYSTPEAGGFPYGITPLALGYNYFERASALQDSTGRRHLYMTEAVVDSRAPVALKYWFEEEWDRGRRNEARLVGKTVPDDKYLIEPVTAELRAGDITDKSDAGRKAALEAIFNYGRAALVAADCAARHRVHMETSTYLNTDYRSHAEEADAAAVYMSAERDYFTAIASQAGFTPPVGSADRAQELLRSARQQYADAVTRYYRHALKYYIEDAVANLVYPRVTGQKLDKATIHRADPSVYPAVFDETRKYIEEQKLGDPHGEDVKEYQSYMNRSRQRIAIIDSLLGTPAPGR